MPSERHDKKKFRKFFVFQKKKGQYLQCKNAMLDTI